MDSDFLDDLDELRHRCGFPFAINSGYRSPAHPKEAVKDTPGQHAKGVAADIAVANGVQRRRVVEEAIKMGVFGGIGVAKTFVHIDGRNGVRVLWTYT